MSEKKKRLIKRLLIAALVLCGMIAVLRPIVLVPFATVTIHYKTDDGIVSTQLEGKEAATVWWMLSGKPLDWNVTMQGGSACGFGPNRAITVGNTTFYVSQDDCGVLQKAGTNNYYRCYGQWERLWEIFEAHGADSCGH